MDLGLAFSYPFQDEDWIKKILIAAVISLIPIIGQIALTGWAVEASRRVIRQDSEPLPEWTDFGGLLSLGLKAWVIAFVLSIPFFIINIPVMIAAAAEAEDAIVTIFSLCASCFAILYGLLLALYIPASYGQLAATDSLGDALNPSKIYQLIRAAPGAYLLTFLGIFLAGIVSGLGIILCFIGILATMAYATAVEGHLFGQAYLQATSTE